MPIDSGADKFTQYYFAIRLLAEKFPSNNGIEPVLLKIAALDRLFSTNIYHPHEYANFLVKNVFTTELTELELLNKMATFRQPSGKEVYCLSFASKYYHFFVDTNLPIYDSYVEKALKKEGYSIKGERKEKYENYVTALTDFRQKNNLKEKLQYNDQWFNVDKYLWTKMNNQLK